MPDYYWTLLAWADQADDVVSRWDSLTAGEKDVVLRETVDRLGKLSRGLAQLMRRE